jgi:hypothetical protein
MASRPPLGPKELTRIERALACLDGLDIETTTALRILMTVTTYVSGSVLNELREIHVEQEQATAGPSQNEIEARMVEWRARLGRWGAFLVSSGSSTQEIDPDAAQTRDERFEFGLSCALDGITTRLR